jgi:acyl carrier protein
MSTISRLQIAVKVRDYVERLGECDDFSDEEDLLEAGILHSIQLVELILFVGEDLGVRLSAGDIYEGHLSSVSSVVDLVTVRLEAAA